MSERSDRDAVPELTCDEVREMAGAFVLGALEAPEAAAVRAHLASCAEAHEEIAELGGVVPALAEIVLMIEPPAGLKARIMVAAAADLAERQGAEDAAGAATKTAEGATPTAFPSAADREASRATGRGRTSTGGWILRIAAVLAIVTLGTWNLLLQNQLNGAKSYEQSVAAVLAVAAQPGSISAILTPDGGTGSGLAAVSASGRVTLAMQNLAPTAGNTVYEAWVIGGDGVPVPVGSFKVGSTGTASFRGRGLPAADGTVLALTLEPGPDAKTPTMPIISKGVAIAPG